MLIQNGKISCCQIKVNYLSKWNESILFEDRLWRKSVFVVNGSIAVSAWGCVIAGLFSLPPLWSRLIGIRSPATKCTWLNTSSSFCYHEGSDWLCQLHQASPFFLLSILVLLVLRKVFKWWKCVKKTLDYSFNHSATPVKQQMNGHFWSTYENRSRI